MALAEERRKSCVLSKKNILDYKDSGQLKGHGLLCFHFHFMRKQGQLKHSKTVFLFFENICRDFVLNRFLSTDFS